MARVGEYKDEVQQQQYHIHARLYTCLFKKPLIRSTKRLQKIKNSDTFSSFSLVSYITFLLRKFYQNVLECSGA